MFAQQSIEIARLEQRANSGARWFYWIAALSLITSLITLSGSSWRFLISLGITQIVTAIGNSINAETGSVGTVMAVVFDLLATGLFAGIGFMAGKRYLWAFVIGMVLFALDGLVFLLSSDWIGLIFHALVIYWIFTGFNACRQLLALQREAGLNQVSNVPPLPPPPMAGASSSS